MIAPTVRLTTPERGVFRVLVVEGAGARVVAVRSWIPRRDGRRSVVVRVAEGGDAAWSRWLPYRSAQDRRNAIRVMRREALRLWWGMMEQEDGDGQQEA